MASSPNPDSNLTKWQKRAKDSGLTIYKNKKVDELSDKEVQEMFDVIRNLAGISYIWHD